MSEFAIRARLRLKPGETYRNSGWRGVCSFEGITAPDGSTGFGCELTVPGTGRLMPNHEVPAILRFWVSPSFVGNLSRGRVLHLLEGGHEIASGIVDEIGEPEVP